MRINITRLDELKIPFKETKDSYTFYIFSDKTYFIYYKKNCMHIKSLYIYVTNYNQLLYVYLFLSITLFVPWELNMSTLSTKIKNVEHPFK